MDKFTLGLVVLLYVAVTVFLGFIGYRKTKSTKDYLLAGREMHPFIMAMSYGATFISTSAIVGFGGAAGLFGQGLLWLTFLNIFIGIFIAFIIFGKRTRKMGHNFDAHTFPEFLGNRYDSKFIQNFAGLIIFIAMPLYAAVVMIGGARYLEGVLFMDFNTALIVFAVITAAYVVAGGLKGVMYTDALQGGIMFFGMAFLLIMTFIKVGGVTAGNEALTNLANLVPEKLQQAGHQGWTAMPKLGSPWWWNLVSTIIMGVGIGVLAQPQLVVRFMTVKSERELNRAVITGGIFIFMMTGVAFIVGSLSNVYFFGETGKIAVAAVEGGNKDLIIPVFIGKAMPQWFGYVFMLTLLAAAMSTMSSQFHVMGTSIGRDFYEQLFKSKGNTILITRIGIVFSIVVSYILASILPPGVIAQGTAIFFGICATTFLPTYFGALYWKRATRQGAKCSIISGLSISLIGLVFIHKAEASGLGICKALFGKDFLIDKYPWMVIDPILIALPISIIVYIVVSLMTTKIQPQHLDKCYKGIA